MAETVSAVLTAINKQFGGHTYRQANQRDPVTRLPTGIFELDYALGGGLPRARFIEIYGPESSCKTNVVFSAIVQNQIINPNQTNVFVDLENAFDHEWAAQWGINTDKLVILEPDSAEDTVDMVEGLLAAQDIGVVALDSLAGMVTTLELTSSASKALPGGAGNVVGKLVRKTVRAMQNAQQEGREPVLICVNQTRFKVGGFITGDPEITPGGNAPKFAASLRLRLYGKNIIDSKVNDAMPAFKEVSAIIKKNKFGILANKAKFTLPMISHGEFQVGQSDCWNFVEKLLRENGDLEKLQPKGYKILGETFDRLMDAKKKFNTDPKYRNKLLSGLMATAMDQEFLEESEDTEADTGVQISV